MQAAHTALPLPYWSVNLTIDHTQTSTQVSPYSPLQRDPDLCIYTPLM